MPNLPTAVAIATAFVASDMCIATTHLTAASKENSTPCGVILGRIILGILQARFHAQLAADDNGDDMLTVLLAAQAIETCLWHGTGPSINNLRLQVALLR